MNLPDRYEKAGGKLSGGMSTAIMYRDKHLDRNVIVKILHSNTDHRRILDEIRALASIRSKHVIEIYDVIRGKSGSIRAIVVEHLPGSDLTGLLGKVDRKQFLEIAYAISSGLRDIHAVGEIHRDIKPQNMKFDAENRLKIYDFGLSRSENHNAETVGLVGTYGYLAPELCVDDDQATKFDKSIDVYAFASTLLALGLGRLPKPMTKIPPMLPCPAGDFSKLAIGLPPDVADILNLCHSYAPTDRPSIDEISELLSLHLLYDQHRASLVVGQNVYSLHSGNRRVNINSGNLGAFQLLYDGLNFTLTPTSGAVYVNNIIANNPVTLPGSCVVTVGPPTAGRNRAYVPVDVSYPEVMV